MIKILYTLIILIILAIIIIYMYNYFKTIEEFTTTVYVDYQPTTTTKYGITCQKASRVYSCGTNDYGQLGLGDNKIMEKSPTPIPIFSNIKAISAGGHYCLFLDNNGKVYSCGLNESGRLGLGNTENKENPTPIPYFSSKNIIITAISAGSYHSLFLDINGNVYSCGYNEYGQLGLGDSGRNNKKKNPKKLKILVILQRYLQVAYIVYFYIKMV